MVMLRFGGVQGALISVAWYCNSLILRVRSPFSIDPRTENKPSRVSNVSPTSETHKTSTKISYKFPSNRRGVSESIKPFPLPSTRSWNRASEARVYSQKLEEVHRPFQLVLAYKIRETILPPPPSSSKRRKSRL